MNRVAVVAAAAVASFAVAGCGSDAVKPIGGVSECRRSIEMGAGNIDSTVCTVVAPDGATCYVLDYDGGQAVSCPREGGS